MENNLHLRIQVFIKQDSPRPVFERVLYLHPDISVKYTELMNSFRFLFGSECVVRIESTILKDM